MTVKVLFFASLRERLQKGEIKLEIDQPLTVQEIWYRSTGEALLPTNIMISVNQDYAAAETLVQANDEVAFFPPVTGG